MEIEVEADRVEASMDRAARRLAQRVRIPGFRPGKAPRQIVERHLGRGAILQEALEDLIPGLYNEALESEQIDPIDQPEFDLKSTEPLVVSATVPVRPTVDLKGYAALRAPRPEVDVTDRHVEEAITNLRRQYATLEPVDRAIQWGDRVRADVSVSVEGQAEPHVEEDAEFAVRSDVVVSLPGFVDRLVGLERGGPHHIEFTLPEDFDAAELAGKRASYEVTVHEVKNEVLPELDDEFIESLDEDGVTTVEELRARIRDGVEDELTRRRDTAYHDEIVDLLVATAELDFPDVLVEREIDRLIDQESNHASHTEEGLNNWLQAIGRTLDDVRGDLREAAELSVRRALVLGELVSAEGVEVDDSAIDAEVERLVEQLTGPEAGDEQRQAIRGLVDTPESRGSMRNQLITRAAIDRLAEICAAGGDVDEDADGDEGDDASGASRRRGSRRRRTRDGETASAEAGDEPAAEIDTDEDTAAADDGEAAQGDGGA